MTVPVAAKQVSAVYPLVTKDEGEARCVEPIVAVYLYEKVGADKDPRLQGVPAVINYEHTVRYPGLTDCIQLT
ncbi:hypothetical protein [Desulforudis sp. DRI-14]|uniref:hypothetical protein n=1 Tax=Desulforudis sp. DRI-14 TaxID=3459793 RepID=UPI0040416797